MVLTIFKQVIIMFILAGVGFIMYRNGKISDEGSKSIGNILIFLSLPCVIINGFLIERTPERIHGLFVSAGLALTVLLVSMLISRIICGRYALDNFAASFSNPGFFGVPIIVASFGNGAVFYIAAFIAFLNLLQWTYGISLLKNCDDHGMLVSSTHEKSLKNRFITGFKKQMKSLFNAPFMIAIIIGMFFFLTIIPMPDILGKCITFIAGVNTPLAMFTIGIYLAQTDIKGIFVKGRLYLVSFVKLLLIPIVTVMMLAVMPIDNAQLKMCILIAAACPVGSNIAVYAHLYKRDYIYAVETVVLSTFFSIVTIPLVISLADYLW